MGRKTLWVDYDYDIIAYSIFVSEDTPVYQVHRVQSGIDFKSNKAAQTVLSPNAYMLFMYLILHSPSKIWALKPETIQKQTTLSAEDITPALQELAEHGYWTPGIIDLADRKFSNNSFHAWEDPSLNNP